MQDVSFHNVSPSPRLVQTSVASAGRTFQPTPQFGVHTSPYLDQSPTRASELNSISSLESIFDDSAFNCPTTRTSPYGQSPRLIDLLLPGSELNARSHDFSQATFQQESTSQFEPEAVENNILYEDVEEVVRRPGKPNIETWVSPPNSPSDFFHKMSLGRDSQFRMLFCQPEMQAGSTEMLMLRFDKQTCGILSVKDGPTENPWRTLVWPLARDSPALYHAIASMTAFHMSKERPALRVDGMEHMRKSIRSLAKGIEKMRTDTALATTLALAFSESWDQHISTGIEHLRGARILVNQALERHSRRALGGDELARLKFLCNTWVYMNVIARLTSIDNEESIDFEAVFTRLYGPFGNHSSQVDPLLGCAATLFPLIGKAASLCCKVRALDTNSVAIISQAMELKEQIVQWRPGTAFEEPEDPSSDIQYALRTAESYRYATLLYLHQAVPEIPSMSCAQLAKKILVLLATVPMSSRLVIIQIYPLLAAGCEAVDSEDRQWVENRWLSMSRRMWIGNLDKCWVVTQEVWRRRDNAQALKLKVASKTSQPAWQELMHLESSKWRFMEDQMEKMFNRPCLMNGTDMLESKRPHQCGTSASVQSYLSQSRKRSTEFMAEELEPDMTVRGKLHWVGVMQDWGWESE